MRMDELNLIAYGKFTDHKLLFPKTTHDFHVIIGPNEAGKSTLRRAITELLFGMERQSPLGFKHPQSDLRVSAVLEAEAGKLAFVRSKQQKSLRSMTDEPLPDTFLSPVLGTLTEEIFAQLHCLDHERLLKGGQGIVDPRNSVSQILFQAASGLEGFAAIGDRLETRAGELFASRGRNNEYTKASDRYTIAQKTLREVQVRTKEWVDARDGLRNADDELDTERTHRRDLETQRSTWERVRRLAPLIERLSRLEQELTDLGDTIAFPSNAKDALNSGISDMNAAAGIVKTRAEDVLERQQQLEAIAVDNKVLQLSADIERLAQLCGLYANHSKDLPLRRAEVNQWLGEVLTRSSEFGWGTTEEEVLTRLPHDRVLRSINALIKEQGALFADERAAKKAEEDCRASIDDLRERLEALPVAMVDPQLTQAFSQALPYKSSESRQKNLRSALTQAEAAAKSAVAALSRPHLTEELLRSMQFPSVERVAGYRMRRQAIAQARELSRSLAHQQEGLAADLGLQISQFVRSHKVTTLAQVAEARRERDEKWSAIKSGNAALSDTASQLDLAIRLADELVDARTLSETDGVALQTLRDQLETATEEQQRQQQSGEQKEHELREFDEQWADEASEIALAGMQLDDLPEWLARREKALQAVDILAVRKHDYGLERDSAAQARDDLIIAISKTGLEVNESLGLATLCTMAEDHIKGIEQARTQHQSLQEQQQAANLALKIARKSKDAKTSAIEQWDSKWKDALLEAHLHSVGDDVTKAQAAIDGAGFIRQRLERIDLHRSERIETMEADLNQLTGASEALAQALAPALARNSPGELSGILVAKLEEARRQSNKKTEAQEFLDSAKRQLAEAQSALKQAKRTLAPLLEAAGVEEPMLALPLVEKAQRKSDLQDSISKTRSELDEGSDGLLLERVQAEVTSHPAQDAPAQLLALKDELTDSEQKLTQLVQAQLAAKQVFDSINGGAQAAVAEAHKQEALADMSEAGEEFVQLAVASSLLKWAIDKYRDRKQGPLLQLANAVFKNLTLGSFEKLRIDYDQLPPALLAYRPNNQAVKVAGLSDGTRDQLFLALRVAALELQAEQGAPVPFIADDLFINFDDKRSQAGLQTLYALSAKTQVLFLSHQEHLLPVVHHMFPRTNVITLIGDEAPQSVVKSN